MTRRRLRWGVGATAVAVALAALAALLTHTVALVTTHGTSMLPHFHSGDLAILTPAASYHVGQIVGYRSPLLHTTVLHRIVAEHHGLFTFKGDHNSFLDPQRLGPRAIEGRLWVHVPRIGAWLSWARIPLHALLAVVAVAATATLVGSKVAARHHSVRRRRRRASRRTTGNPWYVDVVPIALALVVALALGAFTAVSLSEPLVRTSPETVPFAQQTSFDYTSPAVRSATYPDGVVANGTPVFLRLVGFLHVQAAYHLAAPAPSQLRGTMGLVVRLTGPGGWSRTLATTPPEAFRGSRATASAVVNLHAAAAVLESISSETGVTQGAGTIVITPTVHTRGDLGGAPVIASDHPSLAMTFDGLEADLGPTGAGGPGAALHTTRSGTTERSSQVPRHMAILGHHPTVGSARWAGAVGTVLALLLAMAALLWAWRRAGMEEDRLIRSRYGHQLIPVAASPAEGAPSVIDVTNMRALGRLADRYDCFILDHNDGVSHTYFVECGSSVYRYRARTVARPVAAVPFVAAAAAGGGPVAVPVHHDPA